MEAFLQDLRHALRMFRQSPGFTCAAVAALTLGIGTNTAIFSVVNSVLLKPAPFPDPDRFCLHEHVTGGLQPGRVARQVPALASQSNVVQDVSAFRSGVVNLTGGGFPEQLQSAQVSADYFRLFGTPLSRAHVLGRGGQAGRRAGRGAQSRLLESPLRRRSLDPRQDHLAWRRSVRDHRRDERISISAISDPSRMCGSPFQLDPNTTDQGHYFTCRPSEARRDARPGRRPELKLSPTGSGEIPERAAAKSSFSVDPLREPLVRNVRRSCWCWWARSASCS